MKVRGLLLLFGAMGALMVMCVVAVIILLRQDPNLIVFALTVEPMNTQQVNENQVIPPTTPLATLTPTRTLIPPPTLEPPTPLPSPTQTPQVTATSLVALSDIIPPLHGLETATPTNEVGCEPRKDWTLTYEVVHDDALVRIAEKYNTSVDALVKANCLADANVISLGQKLRVPGEGHPAVPAYTCEPWEVLTPMDYSVPIDVNGQLTFNWRGTKATRHLIRVYNVHGDEFWGRVIDLRQNETINLATGNFVAGDYTWQVFPLDLHYKQIPCDESPRWHFSVTGIVPPTPDMMPFPDMMTTQTTP